MGAASSIRMLYKEAYEWFRENIDYELYMEDFRQIDRDGDHTLSFSEIKLWVATNAAKDSMWDMFTTGPVLGIAHKMAALHADNAAVAASNVIDFSEFKTLLVHMYALSIMYVHFTVADNWEGSGGEVGGQDLNVESFKLAVRTFVHEFAQEDLSDADIKSDFQTIDANQSEGVGFFEICNFCCNYIDDKQVVPQQAPAPAIPGQADAAKRKLFGAMSDNLKVKLVTDVKTLDHTVSVDEKNRSAVAVLHSRMNVHNNVAKALANEEQMNAVKRQFRTIDDILSNPICCGYLQKFCQMEYTTENISFVLAVVEFKNLFAADKNVWTTPWAETDEAVRLDTDYFNEALVATSYWSSLSDKELVVQKLNDIFDKYLGADSENEVCISERQRQRTEKRAKLMYLYGPDVFDEACIDPLKTLCKDVLPRFLTSSLFHSMINQTMLCRVLPAGSTLVVPPPNNDLLKKLSPERLDKEDCDFTLQEVMSCLMLYTEFESFVEKTHNSDKFNCMRMIVIYEELIFKKMFDAAIENAWVIYKYFVAVGSAFEVPLSETDRKSIMTSIALPDPEALAPIKKLVSRTLRMCLKVYKTTRNYSQLTRLAREEKQRIQKDSKRPLK
jgi:Regulator of G protein signaling domain